MFYTESTGQSADYETVDTELELMDSVSKQCVTIPIVDNIQIETGEESFFVTLGIMGSTPERVILEKNVAEVTIVDNDGKPHLF